MNKKPVYIFKLEKDEIFREEGYMINIYNGRVLQRVDKTYLIKTVEYDIKENTYICEVVIGDKESLQVLEIIKEKPVNKIKQITVKEKVMIQSRERLPEKNNKWSNWLNNTPCNSFEDAEEMLSELKKTETKDLQFKIYDKSKKEKLSCEGINEGVNKPQKINSEVVEKPFIIQYKERDKTTGVFSGWKLLERFETNEERNEFYSNMIRDNNRIYTIKNVRVTRQHLNKNLEE